MQVELGYILLSPKVRKIMSRDILFGRFIGECLGRQLRGAWNNQQNDISYDLQKKVAAQYSLADSGTMIVILTEQDKNKMPRTTVVFPEEGGVK
jgi:hypothetical protein